MQCGLKKFRYLRTNLTVCDAQIDFKIWGVDALMELINNAPQTICYINELKLILSRANKCQMMISKHIQSNYRLWITCLKYADIMQWLYRVYQL